MIRIHLVLCLILIAVESLAMEENDRSRSMTDKEIDQTYGEAAPDRGAKSQHDALIEWTKGIAESKAKAPGETIPYLGRALVKLSSWNIFQVPERVVVYDAAQAALLAIPGHAEYYRDRMIKAQKERNAAEGTDDYGPKQGVFMNERMYGLETLKHLPSPETVRVLGDFLSDLSATPVLLHQHMKEAPMAVYALGALAKLPIANKPADTKQDYESERDLPKWQQWYEEIKSGKRTFRFEGDPTEYDLNGPAPKEKLERIALHQRMESDRAERHGRKDAPNGDAKETRDEEPTTRKSIDSNMIVAGLALLAAAVWYYARVRKAHVR